ncbi:hypothetical protein [Rugosimonospora africana]|uniref:Uncharacterized protein n=1 Tax=Rugosimonospora africana TaxID=556532 RepID=A0A8J3R291_9ACTN|nr:hypothetical protein [Rugosimonospora africana]GIH18861.1 hypothetical protein Raf01_70330 [Rugosimonospora africana]
MNQLTDSALARLRAADPAPARPDVQSPGARAMLDRVLSEKAVTENAVTEKVVTEKLVRPPAGFSTAGRRVAIGAAGAAAIVAVSALAVVAPWSPGQPASAYTVDKGPDGSVYVTVRLAQLKDPAKLNAELIRARANTLVMHMVPERRCATQPAIDAAFQLPSDATAEQRAAQKAKLPLTYELRGGEVSIDIQPSRIPSGDTLVIGYEFLSGPRGRTSLVRPVVVSAVPPCLAGPEAGALPTPH